MLFTIQNFTTILFFLLHIIIDAGLSTAKSKYGESYTLELFFFFNFIYFYC